MFDITKKPARNDNGADATPRWFLDPDEFLAHRRAMAARRQRIEIMITYFLIVTATLIGTMLGVLLGSWFW